MKHLQKESNFIPNTQEDESVKVHQMDIDTNLHLNKEDEILTAKELDSVLHSPLTENIPKAERNELQELLTMKGNNLIALHSLRKEFESKLKSIHISLILITFMIIVLLMSVIFVIYLNLEIQ